MNSLMVDCGANLAVIGEKDLGDMNIMTAGSNTQDVIQNEERTHYIELGPEVHSRLSCASVGRGLCLKLVGWSNTDNALLTDRSTVLALLAIKALDHLRAAEVSLATGCYQSVPVLLRSTITATGVFIKASKEWRYLEQWMFLTVAGREHFRESDGKFTKFDAMTRSLERQALKAYDGLLGATDLPGTISELVKMLCSHSHPSLMGLIEGLDINVESDEASHLLLQEFFGDDGEAALEEGRGNPHEAVNALLDRQRLRRQFHHRGLAPTDERKFVDVDEGDSLEIGLLVTRPGLADYYSWLILSLVHQLYDVVTDISGSRLGGRAKREGERWHESSLALMQSWKPETN